MRIACISDLHIRATIPENRQDSFTEELFDKLKFFIDYCENNYVQVILIAGDVFNTPIQPYSTLIKTLDILHGNTYSKIDYYAVYGQHDLLFHSKENKEVALNVLESGKALKIINKPVPLRSKDTYLYGCHYGDKIPEIITEGINILVIHKMIIAEKKLFHKQTNYTKSSHLLRKYKFNLIVSGDNHKTFQDVYRNRYLVNSGSLMRSNIDQQKHQPCFFIYDTEKETNQVEKINIPIKPPKEVFIFKEKKEQIETFNDKFTSQFNSEDIQIDYKKNVLSAMTKTPPKILNSQAREIINELFS